MTPLYTTTAAPATKAHGRRWLALLLFFIFPAVSVLAQQHPSESKSKTNAQQAGSIIVRNPSDVPPPVGARGPEVVRVVLTAKEMVAPLDPATGVSYSYWTFDGKVPGPMIRVRVGDTVEVTLYNNASNHMAHSLDFHAALGPGGGMGLSELPPEPGGQLNWGRTFSFKATVPGLFVYHCGTPVAADHIANGMYGLILVEPPGGLSHVDHEYYVMQGEIYTDGPGKRGDTLSLDEQRLLEEKPQFIVFNGAVDALTKQYPLKARVGQTVRIFFGNAGPNLTSSPHVIGEIFNHYYPFGSLESPPLNGVQTGTVPPGGAAILEMKAKMPGQFTLVDHALERVTKGLVGIFSVSGEDVAHLMYAGPDQRIGAIPPLAITPEDADEAFLADQSDAPSPLIAAELASSVAVSTTKVTMTDMNFVPAVIQIRPGQAVTWVNTSGTMHTVVDDPNVALSRADVILPIGAATFASPFMQPGQSYTRVFTQPGVYRYVCTQHERNGMIGTVIVKVPGAGSVLIAEQKKHP